MNINWGVLSIIVLTLVVLMALAVVVVSYVRHWAARHEVSESKLGEGKYFTRFVSEQDQALHQAEQATVLEKNRAGLRRIKKTVIGVFSVSLVMGTAVSLYVNRDGLATDTTLSAEEINNLVTTRHHWQNLYQENIPNLANQLNQFKSHGLVLLGAKALETKSKKSEDPISAELVNIQASAESVWLQFAEERNMKTALCDWDQLTECLVDNEGAIFVLLPDYWQEDNIKQMLSFGASVLAYDAPLQVANTQTDNYFSIYDLKFSPAMDKSDSAFVLAGDKELSLGFDAGTILDISSTSHFYKATSSRPQGLAIDSDHAAGGSSFKTRLYAHAAGEGRLVWMDFSPNKVDHATSVNTKYFEGVLGSIFRYLNKEPYQNLATWPEGKPFAALIEEDTEYKFAAAERVSDFFLENGYPVTWYMLSNLAQKNRAVTRKLAESGQIACHGDNHKAFTFFDAKAQAQRLALCQKTLFEITGERVRSFRPPQEKHSNLTIDAMANNGFTHYIAEHGIDRFVPIIKKSRETGNELINIPRMVIDDFSLWAEMEADEGLSKQITSQEIEYVKVVNGLYMFSFHSQFMDDDKYFSVVRHIAHTVHKKNAYFETAENIAKWWKFRSRLIAGESVQDKGIKQYKPVVLGVNRYGKLTSRRYLSSSSSTASK